MTDRVFPHEHVALQTDAPNANRLTALAALFPEAMTEGQVDVEKLRALLGQDALAASLERYNFSWAGKRDAIRAAQTPSDATLIPEPEQSVDYETTRNLFIEGDNLEVLKLLHRAYFGRVKMVYIDPPYNTGNDFVYPDDYSDPLGEYLRLTGQRDANGNLLTSNPESSGRYHSAWLSMMYPRLALARSLLREDGVIFVSIDDHEIHNLRLLMNEIFGEENFIGHISVLVNPKGRVLSQHFAKTHDYLLVYSKGELPFELGMPKSAEQIEAEYTERDESGRFRLIELRNTHRQFGRYNRPNLWYPLFVSLSSGTVSTVNNDAAIEVWPQWSDGFEGCWSWGKDKALQEQNLLIGKRIKGEWKVFRKAYSLDSEGNAVTKKLKTIWSDSALYTERGQQDFNALMPGRLFQSPKPVALVKLLAQLLTTDDDVILDFFSGSSTTAQAVLELNREDGGNRRFIMVQLPEPTSNAEYPTIAEIGKERIRRVIARMRKADEGTLPLSTREEPEDLGFRVFRLAPSSVRSWQAPAERATDAWLRQMELTGGPIRADAGELHLLWEAAIREGYGLTAQIGHVAAVTGLWVWHVSDADRSQSFYACLAPQIALDALRPLDLARDDLFICRETALDDTAGANLALQCRLKTL